jgi:tetratricopeptide (TPR) repeat protein
MRAAAGALVLLLAGRAGGAPPIELPSKSDTWFRLKTANFTVFSNTTEGRAREIAVDLERLRAVLLYVRRATRANAPVPTYVYVFKRMSSFEPYMPPEYRERFSGFVRVTPDANYYALSATWNSDPRSHIYNEYLLAYIHANFRPQPLWYTVGAAAFYRTFKATDSEAQIGLPVEEYVGLLRGAKMIPLERLFVLDHDSPEYADPHMLDVFHAESWALVHYLLHGASPERKEQLGKFLLLMQDGKPSDAAFHEAFATDYATLLGELYAYVRQSRYNYMRIPYKDLPVPTDVKIEPLSYAETLFRLGDLLLHENDHRLDEAEAFFKAALREDPGLAAAERGLGQVCLDREQDAAAAEYFRKAAASERADALSYYYDARTRMEEIRKNWSWPPTPAQREEIDAARASLRKCIALDPDYAEARVELGRTYFAEDPANLGEGISALTTASALLPSRSDVARDLAQLKLRQQEREAAVARPSTDAATAGDSGEDRPMPTPYPGSRTEKALAGKKTLRGMDTDKVNALLAHGKEDEAVAAMEAIVAQAPAESRPIYQDQLTQLKAGVSRNKAVRAYNAAIALYNRREYPAALQAFEKLAAESPDTEWGKKAAGRVKEIHQILGK